MKRVLITDDAAFIRMSLKQILERNGYEVVGEAANGTESIHKYKHLRPDLVTMDITMPDMDGISAVKEIIQLDPKAKIMMISALAQEFKVRDAILSGAKGFIVKPFKEADVIKALEKL